MSNIKETKSGLIEKSTGRKIESPLDIKCGDVVFCKEHNCNVTVNKVLEDGVLCDWFETNADGTWGKHHQEVIRDYIKKAKGI